MIFVYPSNDHKRSVVGINPGMQINATENENGQAIIEGPTESLVLLAEKILEACR
jgi:hypothetical protein